MSHPHSRINMNQMRAAHNMYELIGAERTHAAKNTQLGFTCELPNLAPSIDTVLAGGEKSGYKFALSDCKSTVNGTVYGYAVNAVPINAELGKYAFCENEQGVLWYSKNGSADDCLKDKVPWPNDQQAFQD
jgi:hypothetical protein